MKDSLAVSLSVHVYRGLIRTYPRKFRQAYGEAMVQVFRDLCLQPGMMGLANVWGRALLDYIVSIVSEHMDRGVAMTKTKWIQMSGWGLAASGFLLMAGLAAGSRPDYDPYNSAAWPIDPVLNIAGPILMTAAMLLITAGLFGMGERFQGRISLMGRSGLALGIFTGLVGAMGAAGLGFFKSGAFWSWFMMGVLGVNLGLALVGFDCLRQRLFARWNGLPLAIGIVFSALVLASMGPIHIEWPGLVEFILLLVFALGLGLVGYLLQSRPTETPTTTPA